MANLRIVTGAQGAQFTGAAAQGLKTVNVIGTGPTGPAPSPVKEHKQVAAAQHTPGVMPTVLLAPTGTKGIPTIVVPGFAGPA